MNMNATGFRFQYGSLSPLAALLALFVVLECQAENWPAWRGPTGSGVSAEMNLPIEWSPTENVRWHVSLPEPGNGSPIVWGRQVFITQPLEDEKRRAVVCYDRDSGKQLWQSGLTYDGDEDTHRANPYCSPSPVTDGQRVICWFGSAGLVAFDMDGRELWRRELGRQEHMWGYSTSPVLHGELCILHFGPGNREFLVAVDKRTGESVWQVDEPPPSAEGDLVEAGQGTTGARSDPDEPRAEILRGSWATPIVVPGPDRDELIVCHPTRVVAYDPASGDELWTCRELGSLVYASPSFGDGVLVAMGGYAAASLAVRPGGQGDVTESHRLWHRNKSKKRLGTGVHYQGYLFINTMEGFADCLDVESGDEVWSERLTGNASKSASWCSFTLTGDGLIYAPNQAGDTFVFRAGPEFELLATNTLGEETNSSIAVSNGHLFIRTHKSLWCIGQQAANRSNP